MRVTGYSETVPDLVVEIASHGDSRREARDKAHMWLNHGVRLVWVVQPETRTVDVYRSDQAVVTLGERDALDGLDVLPGFARDLGAVFGTQLAEENPEPDNPRREQAGQGNAAASRPLRRAERIRWTRVRPPRHQPPGAPASNDGARCSGVLARVVRRDEAPSGTSRQNNEHCTIMSLFAPAEEHATGWPPPGASWFAIANQASEQRWTTVRQTIEEWYSRYPDHQARLRSRLQKNDQNSLSAFFELFLHELFLCLQLRVTVEPEIPSRTKPDFLTCDRAGRAAYVEATVAATSRDDLNENQVIDSIRDLDGRVPAGIGVIVSTSGRLDSTPPIRKIQNDVCNWLNSAGLVIDPGGKLGKPGFSRTIGGWRMSLYARPRGSGSVVQIRSADVHRHGKTVPGAIRSKAKQHAGVREHPIVLAIDDVNSYFHEDEEDEFFREFWAAHAEIGAVLIFDGVVPWSHADLWEVHVRLNPAREDDVPEKLGTLGHAASPSIRESLRLTPGWPDPEGLKRIRAVRDAMGLDHPAQTPRIPTP